MSSSGKKYLTQLYMVAITGLLKSLGFSETDFTDMESLELPEPEEGETLAGQLTSDEAQCIAAADQLGVRHKQLHLEMDEAEDADTQTALTKEHGDLVLKNQMLKTLLWTLIKLRIPENEEAGGLSIRKGGQIMYTPKKEEDVFGGGVIVMMGKDSE